MVKWIAVHEIVSNMHFSRNFYTMHLNDVSEFFFSNYHPTKLLQRETLSVESLGHRSNSSHLCLIICNELIVYYEKWRNGTIDGVFHNRK